MVTTTDKKQEDAGVAADEAKIPSFCLCPVTFEPMRDPVIVDATCKHTCNRESVERWFALGKDTCPICGIKLTSTQLSPNSLLRDAITKILDDDEQIPIKLVQLTGQKYHWKFSKHKLWKEEMMARFGRNEYDTIERVIFNGKLICPEARIDEIGFFTKNDDDFEKNVCHIIRGLSWGIKAPTTVVLTVDYRFLENKMIPKFEVGLVDASCDIFFAPQCPKTWHAKREDVKCQWCGRLPYPKLLVERKRLCTTVGASSSKKRKRKNRRRGQFLSIDIGLKRLSYPGKPDIFWLEFDQFNPPDDAFTVRRIGSGKEILGSLRGPSSRRSWNSCSLPTITWMSAQPLDSGEYLVRFEEERLPWQGNPGDNLGRSEWTFEIV